MSSFIPDILIDLTFPIKNPDGLVIETNAKPEVVEEILTDWIQLQLGLGSDSSEAVDRETYNIKIGLRISDDAYAVESDTNNKGLTVGIVMTTINRLAAQKGKIRGFGKDRWEHLRSGGIK